MVRIAEIEAGSVAEELHLEIGTRIVRINGLRVRDGIDLTYLTAEPELELEAVAPDGEVRLVEIRRDEGRPLGIIPAPDPVRECANECVFCFIDGNPRGVRPSLWLRDDDFRLSFTYGSYVTLTNLGPRGLERLVEQQISPLYVSVHATEPDVRVRMLKNDRAGLILDQLGYLLDNGLEIHTQVVLCPEWNDGAHLDRTMGDLFGLGSGVRSLSVVPVGLTRFNVNRPVRPLTASEAAEAIRQVDGFRPGARKERGQGWAYTADEMYLAAGAPLPGKAYYDEWDLTENGVGSVVRFLEASEEGLQKSPPRLDGRRLVILTGTSMAPFMEDLSAALREATGAGVDVRAVKNEFYGELVTVAGLLAGCDLLEAARDVGEGDIVLLPTEALNADDLFIDSMPLGEFESGAAPARVVPALDLARALETL